MSNNYFFSEDLVKEVEIPKNGILSRTLYSDDQMKVILFGFDTGQELSKHTASVAAVVHILKGEATLTLGGDAREVGAGAWAHMAPRLEHAILAKTPVVMLLTMMQSQAA
jgi:quercetin dioxygenase-like cupin family protein